MGGKRYLVALLMIVFALSACGGGGGGDGAAVSSEPTLISTTSVMNQSDEPQQKTDGEWIVWSGKDRERIVVLDGTEVMLPDNGLDGLVVKELAFDGRYVLFRAMDPIKPGESSAIASTGDWSGRSELYYYDTAVSNPTLQTVTWDDDWPYDIQVSSGVATWVSDHESCLYALDLEGISATPVKVSGSESVSYSSAHPVMDGAAVVFRNGNGVFYADLSSLPAFSTAADLTNISATGEYPRLEGDKVVWTYGNNIYAYDLTAEVGTRLSTNSAYNPDVDGDIAVWREYDGAYYQIYYADISDLAATVETMQLTDGTVSVTNFPSVEDGYVAWVCNDALYAADLNAAVPTSTVVMVTEDIDVSMNYHDYYESWWRQYFNLGEGGQLYWTQFDVPEDSSDWYELLYRYDIASGETVYQPTDLGIYQRYKEMEAAGGKLAWLSMGAYSRIYAYNSRTGAGPLAITDAGMNAHQPEVDNGILTFTAKPGPVRDEDSGDLREVYYADLNGDRQPVQITYNFTEDDRPQVDGANGIITWVNWDDDCYYYANIDDLMVRTVPIPDYTYCFPVIDDGIIAVRTHDGSYNYNLWVYPVGGMPREVTGDMEANRRPALDDGIVVWMDDSSYDLHYFDVSWPGSSSKAITETVDVGSTEGWNCNVSAGTVVFEGYMPAASSTEVIFTYSVGDPADSVAVIYTNESTDTDVIVQLDIDDDMVVWKNADDAIDKPEVYTYNLTTEVLTEVTDNMCPDNHPDVVDGLVVWMSGSGEPMVYAAKP